MLERTWNVVYAGGGGNRASAATISAVLTEGIVVMSLPSWLQVSHLLTDQWNMLRTTMLKPQLEASNRDPQGHRQVGTAEPVSLLALLLKPVSLCPPIHASWGPVNLSTYEVRDRAGSQTQAGLVGIISIHITDKSRIQSREILVGHRYPKACLLLLAVLPLLVPGPIPFLPSHPSLAQKQP